MQSTAVRYDASREGGRRIVAAAKTTQTGMQDAIDAAKEGSASLLASEYPQTRLNRRIDTNIRLENGRYDDGLVMLSTSGALESLMFFMTERASGRARRHAAASEVAYSATDASMGKLFKK